MVLPGNAQAIGRRAEQQDAFAFSDLADAAFCAHSGALCVVCDGMGGHAAGGEAARAAVAQFLESYGARDTTEPIERSLFRALDAANEAVLEIAAQAGDSGSTLVAAVIHDGRLHWISLGDSRLWLLRAGRLHRINREHRHRSALLRQAANGDLPWAEAQADPLGERLTASLGEAPLPAADGSLRAWPLLPGDQVLLATDGLYRSVDRAQLEAASAGVEAAAPGTQALCDRWAELALAAELPDQDNLTVAGLAWHPEASEAASTATAMATPMVDDPRIVPPSAPSLPVTAPLPPQHLAPPAPGARPPRFHRPIALAGLVLAGAAVAWFAQPGPEPEPTAPLPAPGAPAASRAEGVNPSPDRPKRAVP